MRTAQKPNTPKATPVERAIASCLAACPERFQKEPTAFDQLARELHGKWNFVVGPSPKK